MNMSVGGGVQAGTAVWAEG